MDSNNKIDISLTIRRIKMKFAWWQEDGLKLATLIRNKLLETGQLNFNEILDIFDGCGFPVFRKTEGAVWTILSSWNDIESFKDERGGICLKLKVED
jgi:hypothetical protein